MVIAQDWGGVDYFIDHKGLEEDTNTTNKRVCGLLSSIGISIQLPQQTRNSALFFTNSVLCLRPGRLTGPIKTRWFTNCSTTFLRPQVELVNPKVVVTLGHMAYCALLKAYSLTPKPRMREAVQEIVRLPGGNLLVPVFHPGNNGTRSRSFENQKADWQRVRIALDGKQN
jgi:uracil-DNA glycosylase family 4